METTALEISSLLGLFALIMLTFNFLLGLLLSTSYRRSGLWKRLPEAIKKLSLNRIHNWTAYVAFAVLFLHPLLLTFDQTTKFAAADIFIPFHASYDPFLVALGVLSFYAVLLVIITTQKFIKRKLGFRLWKNIHLISYFTALLMCVHGIFLDPELRQRSPDFFDGEKLVCEFCFLVLIGAAIIRMQFYYNRKNKLSETHQEKQELV